MSTDTVVDDGTVIVLPYEINRAPADDDVEKVLKWLLPGGDRTTAQDWEKQLSPQRLNAKCVQYLNRTLLHEAELENSIGLMSILLQQGAEVDPFTSSVCSTPLQEACSQPGARCDDAARLLLTWGADKTMMTGRGDAEALARICGNKSLANLLKTPLGGRRCEMIGLVNSKNLNGLTCIVTKYLPKDDRYVVQLERGVDVMKVKPENLKRRDRTREDHGVRFIYYCPKPGSIGYDPNSTKPTYAKIVWNPSDEDKERFNRNFERDGKGWHRLKK